MVVLVGSRRALAKTVRTQGAGGRYTGLTQRLRPEESASRPPQPAKPPSCVRPHRPAISLDLRRDAAQGHDRRRGVGNAVFQQRWAWAWVCRSGLAEVEVLWTPRAVLIQARDWGVPADLLENEIGKQQLALAKHQGTEHDRLGLRGRHQHDRVALPAGVPPC